MKFIAGILVGSFGGFLIVLALLSIFAPPKAARFLDSFAASAKLHFFEIGIRFIIGTALIFFASEMWFSQAFYFFGWVVILTSAGLLLIPWQKHRTISERTVPTVIRHLTLFGLAAFALGIFIFYGISRAIFL